MIFASLFLLLAVDWRNAASACGGDLDDDGEVDVSEIVELVACALDPGRSAGCPAIHIDDLVKAVNNALYGCGADPIWMTYVACRQCEGCRPSFGTIDSLLRLLDEGRQCMVADILPEGVAVLECEVEVAQGVIALCGAPASGSPVISVLVRDTDRQRLIDAGWTMGRRSGI